MTRRAGKKRDDTESRASRSAQGQVRLVERFNSKYKVGDKLKLRTDAGWREVTVKAPASMLGGHSAVGWFEEISGSYSIDGRVEVVEPVEVLYKCPTCKEIYETLAEAEACRDTPIDYRGLFIGEIVLVPSMMNYHLMNYDERYVLELPPDTTGSMRTSPRYVPYCVVVGLSVECRSMRRGHRAVVTLAVPYKSGVGVRYGWTPADGEGHYGLYRFGKPWNEQRSLGHSEQYIREMLEGVTITPNPLVYVWANELAGEIERTGKQIIGEDLI